MIISPHKINWSLFGEAIEHYEELGYSYIEVPWKVESAAVRGTLPPHITLELLDERNNLVGSAEQSFMQMMIDGTLKEGRYQTITPCFRNEPVYDDLHQHHFMKLELIDFSEPTDDKFKQMMSDADAFFRPRVYMNDLRYVLNGESMDIEHNGIELGSYGWRSKLLKHKSYSWIYGTGLAEPRFSYANSLSC